MNQLFEEDYGIRVETAEALLPYNYDPSMENFIFFWRCHYSYMLPASIFDQMLQFFECEVISPTKLNNVVEVEVLHVRWHHSYMLPASIVDQKQICLALCRKHDQNTKVRWLGLPNQIVDDSDSKPFGF